MLQDSTVDQVLHAMRGIASTVHVVTIQVDGKPLGMTATAVSSLTMDPPSLLVCVNESASMHRLLLDRPHFCVNVLHADQIEVARLFSNSAMREVRFSTGAWNHDCPAPFLSDAQAVLMCRSVRQHRFGTHTIFIGEIEGVRMRGTVDPLVYVNGQFGRVAA